MAAGDNVVVFFSFSGAGYVNYQPAAGVEVIILQTDDFDTHYLYLYNGTLESLVYNPTYTGKTPAARFMKLCLSNTNYMRMYNSSGSNTGSVCGIQTK